MGKLFICTIVAKNYMAYARCLTESFLNHHPEGQVIVMLVDELDEGSFDAAEERFTTVLASEIGIPDFKQMAFRYSLLELNTAVKPFLLEYVFREYSCRKLCYFDPDIYFYNRIDEIINHLDKHGIVLTPHLTGLPVDESKSNELDVLRSGAYNLGFIGLSKHQELETFLHWWQVKLRKHCKVDPDEGLFVDQRWIDLAPGLFSSVYIHRDPGCNVAYWNLHHRSMTRTDSSYAVNGSPLKFFHFSGFSPDHIQAISKHQHHYTLEDFKHLAPLFYDYRTRLLANGHKNMKNLRYAYDYYDNDKRIVKYDRYLWREIESNNSCWLDPFDTSRPDSFIKKARANRLRKFIQQDWGKSLYLSVGDLLIRAGARPYFKQAVGENFIDKVRQKFFSIGSRSKAVPGDFAVLRPLPGGDKPRQDNGLNVIGYLRDATGVGESARAYLRALGEQGFPVACTLLHSNSRQQEDISALSLPRGNPYGVSLFLANADQVPLVYDKLGPEFFVGKYNIGYWAWELAHFPTKWFDRFAYFDELWVGSSFVQTALSRLSPVPAVNMGIPIEPRKSSGATRESLGLPEEKFCFLFVFDMLSVVERKNPLGLIEAYRFAFEPHFENTSLVIKVTNLDEFPQNKNILRDAVDSVSGILVENLMSRQELNDLFSLCDAYVSLHRSEGFGLTIAEAMQMGKPVIATDYSANEDYMTLHNSYPVAYRLVELEKDYGPYRKGQIWADPDLQHAATQMRRVFENPEEAAPKGACAARDIQRLYSNEAIAQRIIERLKHLGLYNS
jgi:glycosyltransferase involved in cell wall biosynthesis